MVLKIYQNANSPQGCGLYFAKYSPQPASNIPHGEFLSTVNLNFVPQRNNSTANIRIQHMYVRSGLTPSTRIKSAKVRRCAHVLVFTTSRSNESLKNQLQFAGLPKSHADGFQEEDALEDSTITQHCCQEFLLTLSRRSSQHHVGRKLLAAENPHSVRYRTARRTRPWNLSSKTRATEGCMRPQHLMSARSS